MNNDIRQRNTLAFLHDRLLRRDLKVFQSAIAFLDINKVGQEVVAGGFTVMQTAAMYGLEQFVDVLLQGILKYQTILGS